MNVRFLEDKLATVTTSSEIKQSFLVKMSTLVLMTIKICSDSLKCQPSPPPYPLGHREERPDHSPDGLGAVKTAGILD